MSTRFDDMHDEARMGLYATVVGRTVTHKGLYIAHARLASIAIGIGKTSSGVQTPFKLQCTDVSI